MKKFKRSEATIRKIKRICNDNEVNYYQSNEKNFFEITEKQYNDILFWILENNMLYAIDDTEIGDYRKTVIEYYY